MTLVTHNFNQLSPLPDEAKGGSEQLLPCVYIVFSIIKAPSERTSTQEIMLAEAPGFLGAQSLAMDSSEKTRKIEKKLSSVSLGVSLLDYWVGILG